MHEMSIVTSIIRIVREEMAQNGARHLKGIKIRVGEMAAVEPEAFRCCFDVCT